MGKKTVEREVNSLCIRDSIKKERAIHDLERTDDEPLRSPIVALFLC